MIDSTPEKSRTSEFARQSKFPSDLVTAIFDFRCDICNYRSGDHNTLRRHKMRHSGEKKYKCPYCSYSCIQATSFKAHIRRKHQPHAEQVVFQCTKCDFRTVSQGNFLAHLVEHSDEGDGGNGGKVSKSEVKAQEADTTTDDGSATPASSK